MTGNKFWEHFGPNDFTVPSPERQLLAFLAPGSSDDAPKWVTYPGETFPLVGKVMLTGKDDQLLVKPPNGELICINGRAVKLTEAAHTPNLRKHMKRFRFSVHGRDKQETVRIMTDLLTANQRQADADTDSFVEFVRCNEEMCGFSFTSDLVLVKLGQEVPKGVFYIWPDMSKVLEDFLSVNNCTHLMLHPPMRHR